MCGIAGVVSRRSAIPDDIGEHVGRMCRSIAHRGPDDNGLAIRANGRVALGNQRLAIRDLSPAGHMPMANAAGDVWITYNGEIYNADDLRRELERDGVAFRSTSDTEVILHGYERWGEQIVSRLRGMFAFAVLDERGVSTEGRKRAMLFLARDRLGIKPLYYAADSENVVFASECRGVLASGLVSREISPRGLLTYLRLGSMPAPLTIYRDIHALPAGTTLTIGLDARAFAPVLRTYWTLPSDDQRPTTNGQRRTTDDLQRVLTDAIKRHLVSDVPLGAFLSGGLDSTAVVALTRLALPHGTIRTCTLAFDADNRRDVNLARLASRALDTEHVEVAVTADEVARDLDAIVAALDQPSNDGLNTYLVSKAARSVGLTVALSGIGGDELFGGYPTFRRLGMAMRLAEAIAAVPAAPKLFAASVTAMAPYHPIARLADWTAVGGSDPAAQYLGLRGFFAANALANLVSRDILADDDSQRDLLQLVRDAAQPSPTTDDRRPTTDHRPTAAWDAASRLELTCYMRHQLLRDADAMSMAHSLEVRVPLVDHEVVEAILRTPVEERRGEPPKRLLRSLVPNLPPEIRDRPDKETFSLPLDRWMSGPLRPRLGELVDRAEERFKGILIPGSGRRLLAAFDRGRVDWSRPWAIAALATVAEK
jgi:asparagine synthase (glutamine-hydrolysing)